MPLTSRFLLPALALGVAAWPALGQGKTAAPGAPIVAAPVAPAVTLPAPATLVTNGPRGEQFILGPDDVISLQVANHPEMSADSLTLSSTGRVALPILGPLTIKGKTLEQARGAIAAAYKSQLRDPKVSITLVRARPRQATVLGAVARPGAVDLQPGWRVSEVLAAVGGLNDLTPEDVKVTLKKLNGPPTSLDIATIYRAPENPANPRVNVNDVISVVKIPQISVTVNGDVGAPGPQNSRSAPKLVDAIGRAGDLKLAPNDTDINLLRGGRISALDVADAFANPAGKANIELQDGDLLSVTGVRLNVNVLADENLIKAPGNYTLDGRSSFTRAISAAGGPTVSTDKILASVRRGNQIIPVDLTRALYDPNADIALQNNDIVMLKPLDGPRVRVGGEIKSPGQYNFKDGTKVLSAILEAGGLNIPVESARISILRTLPDGRQIPLQVDAAPLLRGTDVSQNATLQNGDIVLASSMASRSVSVVGKVEKEGVYELKNGDSLTEALLNAGGATSLAALSRITIYGREGASRVVDYSNLGQGEVPLVKLEDGDRVQVPLNPNQVLLMDGVVKPGPYAIPEGATLTLAELINRAGGTLPGSRTNDITLLRPVPVAPNAPEGYRTERIKFDDARNGKVAGTLNLALMPGDVVLVPGPKNQGRSGLQTAVTALGAFSALRGF